MADAEIVMIALKNLKTQKMRTVLTILGIIIGIGAIVAVISVGAGLNLAVKEQFQSLGKDTLIVLPGSTFIEVHFAKLEEDDVGTIKDVRGVESVAEIFIVTRRLEFQGATKSAMVIGVDPEKGNYLKAFGVLDVGEGRTLTSKDTTAVVIGAKFAERVFEKPVEVGQTIKMVDLNTAAGEKNLRVVGINSAARNTFGTFFNDAAVMTADSLKEISTAELTPARIMVSVAAGESIDDVKERIKERLKDAHGEEDFQIIAAEQIGSLAQSVVGVIQLVLLGIAAISLVVGGIGIMNTMLMTVMERTREIGIMKAIGATNSRILAMFLLEAGFIGLIGGVLGAALGYGAAVAVSSAATLADIELPVALDLPVTLAVLAFSMLIGIVSGIVPARRAALLEPVAALREE